MEPFVDFGLIELLAASGLAWLARRIYARPAPGVVFVVVSVLLPAILVIASKGVGTRWVAIGCLATALVNAAALLTMLRRAKSPQPQGQPRERRDVAPRTAD
jgi:peptidoglycan biosynthesis protein MviN/MurJ (putative lipid II flippase)